MYGLTKLCLRLRRRRPRAYAVLFAVVMFPSIAVVGTVFGVVAVAYGTARHSWRGFKWELRDEVRFLKWVFAEAAAIVRRSWRRGRVYGIIDDNESKGGKEE